MDVWFMFKLYCSLPSLFSFILHPLLPLLAILLHLSSLTFP